MSNHTTVNISTHTILKVVLVLILLWFIYLVKDIVLVLLISIIISSALDPVADYLQKRRIPRGLSVFVVYIILLGVVGVIVALMVPPVTQQFQQISQQNYFDDFNSKIGIFRANLEHFGIGKTVENNFKDIASSLGGTLFQTTKGVVTGIVSFFTILVISFYMTAEENGLKNFVKFLTPYRHQAYAMNLTNKIQKKMGYWVLGQVILSFVIFGLTYLGLVILHVKFALVLALIAGLLEIVPYIGPFVSLLPAVFFAFLQSPALAIAVIILYLVVQQFEAHIIVPVVMSKSVGLNPVVVILGILIGGTLAGVVGALIAIPVLSGASVFLADLMSDEKRAE
ncbi:MAG: AI-2E family transporter [Candidatus Saccharibacteria bacterium]